MDDDENWTATLLQEVKDVSGIVLVAGPALDFARDVLLKKLRGLPITDNTLRHEANPVGSLFLEAGSAINDIVDAFGKVGTKAEKRLLRGTEKMLSVLGQFFGIPVRTGYNVIESVLQL